jgi:H+-translocating NAD(P) transhydrogenase
MAPPPRPQVQAKTEEKPKEKQIVVKNVNPFADTLKSSLLLTTGLSTLIGLGYVSPSLSFANMITTFSLAGIVGYQVVWGVSPSLHSPLMSVTNAISGIIVVGGLLLMGGGYFPNSSSTALAALAVFISSINITGGFLITKRMLDMFRRPTDPKEHNYLYSIPGIVFLGAYLLLSKGTFDPSSLHSMAYLASSILSVLSLGGLANQSTARIGNALGMLGIKFY